MSILAASGSPEIAESGQGDTPESNWISLLALRAGLCVFLFVHALNTTAGRVGVRVGNEYPASTLRIVEFAMYGISAVLIVASCFLIRSPRRDMNRLRGYLGSVGFIFAAYGLGAGLGIERGIRVGADPLVWFDFEQRTQDIASWVLMVCLLVAGLGFYLRRRRARA